MILTSIEFYLFHQKCQIDIVHKLGLGYLRRRFVGEIGTIVTDHYLESFIRFRYHRSFDFPAGGLAIV